MQNYVKTIEYMVKQNTNAKIPKECRDIIFLVIFQFVNHLFTLARHYSHLQNPERPRRPHARGADLQRVVDPGCVCRAPWRPRPARRPDQSVGLGDSPSLRRIVAGEGPNAKGWLRARTGSSQSARSPRKCEEPKEKGPLRKGRRRASLLPK